MLQRLTMSGDTPHPVPPSFGVGSDIGAVSFPRRDVSNEGNDFDSSPV